MGSCFDPIFFDGYYFTTCLSEGGVIAGGSADVLFKHYMSSCFDPVFYDGYYFTTCESEGGLSTGGSADVDFRHYTNRISCVKGRTDKGRGLIHVHVPNDRRKYKVYIRTWDGKWGFYKSNKRPLGRKDVNCPPGQALVKIGPLRVTLNVKPRRICHTPAQVVLNFIKLYDDDPNFEIGEIARVEFHILQSVVPQENNTWQKTEKELTAGTLKHLLNIGTIAIEVSLKSGPVSTSWGFILEKSIIKLEYSQSYHVNVGCYDKGKIHPNGGAVCGGSADVTFIEEACGAFSGDFSAAFDSCCFGSMGAAFSDDFAACNT